MAAMSTALTEYSDSYNSRTYIRSGHTALSPSLVIQKRTVPSGATGVVSDSIKTVDVTDDADGIQLDSKVTFEVIVRRPVNGTAADVTAALAVFRDIVAGDEFTATVNQSTYLV
jgi:hypothetical protein